MRYDTPVYFQHIERGAYDANTGNYEPDTVTETMRFASVTDTGMETVKLIYGAIRQGSCTVRIQTAYNAPFDYIRIGEKRYQVDMTRRHRVKQSYIVSEVQNGKGSLD